MCGRFYVPEDSEIAMLRKVIENLESRNDRQNRRGESRRWGCGDCQQSGAEATALWDAVGIPPSQWKAAVQCPQRNCRAKAIFADGMAHRRCLILASHYFEWQDTPDGKAKYAIAPKESSGMLLAVGSTALKIICQYSRFLPALRRRYCHDPRPDARHPASGGSC